MTWKPEQIAKEWKSFKRTFAATINRDSKNGYIVRPDQVEAEYKRQSNPHCHSLTAILTRDCPKMCQQIAVILALRGDSRFRVAHSIVLSADAKSIVADTYTGKMENGVYYYNNWPYQVVAAWRLHELKRAANAGIDLDSLPAAKAALTATAK